MSNRVKQRHSEGCFEAHESPLAAFETSPPFSFSTTIHRYAETDCVFEHRRHRVTTDLEAVRYYGYRYYNPGLGRWVNRDPIGEQGGVSVYLYISNVPVNGYEFIGLYSLDNCTTKDDHYHASGGALTYYSLALEWKIKECDACCDDGSMRKYYEKDVKGTVGVSFGAGIDVDIGKFGGYGVNIPYLKDKRVAFNLGWSGPGLNNSIKQKLVINGCDPKDEEVTVCHSYNLKPGLQRFALGALGYSIVAEAAFAIGQKNCITVEESSITFWGETEVSGGSKIYSTTPKNPKPKVYWDGEIAPIPIGDWSITI